MSDTVVNLLRLIRADITKVIVRLDDLVDGMRRIEQDISTLRGSSDSVRYDLGLLTQRWRNLEERVRILELPDEI